MFYLVLDSSTAEIRQLEKENFTLSDFTREASSTSLFTVFKYDIALGFLQLVVDDTLVFGWEQVPITDRVF